MIAQASRAIIAQSELKAAPLAQLMGPVSTDRLPEITRTLDENVSNSEPIYVSWQVSETIARMSAPEWRLRPNDLPTRGGFIWLGGADGLPSFLGETLSAILYMPAILDDSSPVNDVVSDDAAHPANGLAVFWVFGWGPEANHILNWWRFGETAGDVIKKQERLASPHPDEILTVNPLAVRFFAAAILFMQQRLLSREKWRGDRAARRIAERAGLPDKEVLVVALRKSTGAHSDEKQSGEARDYSHRWWVGTHWRNQRVGEGLSETRPTLISPYIKGPEDKPIRTARRLFAVVR